MKHCRFHQSAFVLHGKEKWRLEPIFTVRSSNSHQTHISSLDSTSSISLSRWAPPPDSLQKRKIECLCSWNPQLDLSVLSSSVFTKHEFDLSAFDSPFEKRLSVTKRTSSITSSTKKDVDDVFFFQENLTIHPFRMVFRSTFLRTMSKRHFPFTATRPDAADKTVGLVGWASFGRKCLRGMSESVLAEKTIMRNSTLLRDWPDLCTEKALISSSAVLLD